MAPRKRKRGTNKGKAQPTNPGSRGHDPKVQGVAHALWVGGAIAKVNIPAEVERVTGTLVSRTQLYKWAMEGGWDEEDKENAIEKMRAAVRATAAVGGQQSRELLRKTGSLAVEHVRKAIDGGAVPVEDAAGAASLMRAGESAIDLGEGWKAERARSGGTQVGVFVNQPSADQLIRERRMADRLRQLVDQGRVSEDVLEELLLVSAEPKLPELPPAPENGGQATQPGPGAPPLAEVVPIVPPEERGAEEPPDGDGEDRNG